MHSRPLLIELAKVQGHEQCKALHDTQTSTRTEDCRVDYCNDKQKDMRLACDKRNVSDHKVDELELSEEDPWIIAAHQAKLILKCSISRASTCDNFLQPSCVRGSHRSR